MDSGQISRRRNLSPRDIKANYPKQKKTKCVLLGYIQVGKRRVSKVRIPIRIVFKAFGPNDAKKIGLVKIKGFSGKEMKSSQATSMKLTDVRVENGKFMIPLESEFSTRNILYVRSPNKAFGKTVWFKDNKLSNATMATA